jgi:uncharacterized protein YfaS (alpha-2-macroglobulin family)
MNEAMWYRVRYRIDSTSPVRLHVTFDKTRLKLGEHVTTHVEVSRTRGGGMLLGEIGLPPGVDVDRASLEEAKRRGTWLQSYEVQPDRLIVYLWPGSPAEANFSFRFQPRFAMSARSAASEVYDYYNPEARALAQPVKFVVE